VTEDEVVAAIGALCKPESSHGRRIVLGIGDDAALWRPSRSHLSAISSDMLVEGVDFTDSLMGLEDAGWRAMAANVSDLAAMGARPVLATVAFGVARERGAREMLECYRGIAAAAQRWHLSIAGGDLSRAPVLTLAITVVGEVRASNAKRRDGAHPGDVLAVTGPLGNARAGFELARDAKLNVGRELRAQALSAFRRPEARVAEGRFLAASRNVRALMDCSDGLSTDVARLVAASRCGAAIETVPVADAARAVAQMRDENPERFALGAGEDFELIVAVRAASFRHLALRYRAHFGRDLIRIGTLVAQPGITWNGAPLERSGWDHFADGA
jgi:thiamine-monophosphate kinase